jgi:hypothetical protein
MDLFFGSPLMVERHSKVEDKLSVLKNKQLPWRSDA